MFRRRNYSIYKLIVQDGYNFRYHMRHFLRFCLLVKVKHIVLKITRKMLSTTVIIEKEIVNMLPDIY